MMSRIHRCCHYGSPSSSSASASASAQSITSNSSGFNFGTNWPFYFLILIIIITSLISGINCIQINRFQVPEAVERGKSAILNCDYTLDVNEELYAIKFYKNNIEFFRYVPKENPAKQSYRLIGIYVNLKASNSTHVVLSQTNLNSDGLYICEISTEGPSFSTVRSEQLMKIYVLPDQNIRIHGALDQYNYGDNISLVCKSGKSWPPLKLEWLINDVLVDDKYVINMINERSTSSLVTSKIGLNINAKPRYFRNGFLEIKCRATLTIVYEYESVEHLVTGSSKNKNRIKEWSLQPNIRTPVISGLKKNYRMDDILNLNCTSKIKNAKLKWYINQKEANESDLVRYNDRAEILGLWIRMDKRFVQMPELQLRCVANFFKQIRQFQTSVKIRTLNHNNPNNKDEDNYKGQWENLSNHHVVHGVGWFCLLPSLIVNLCIILNNNNNNHHYHYHHHHHHS